MGACCCAYEDPPLITATAVDETMSPMVGGSPSRHQRPLLAAATAVEADDLEARRPDSPTDVTAHPTRCGSPTRDELGDLALLLMEDVHRASGPPLLVTPDRLQKTIGAALSVASSELGMEIREVLGVEWLAPRELKALLTKPLDSLRQKCGDSIRHKELRLFLCAVADETFRRKTKKANKTLSKRQRRVVKETFKSHSCEKSLKVEQSNLKAMLHDLGADLGGVAFDDACVSRWAAFAERNYKSHMVYHDWCLLCLGGPLYELSMLERSR